MHRDPPPNLNRNVSPSWKPVDALAKRPAGMAWSDRVFHWLCAIGSLALIAAGVGVLAYLRWAKLGGTLIGVGLVAFTLSSPGQAARNGYRSS